MLKVFIDESHFTPAAKFSLTDIARALWHTKLTTGRSAGAACIPTLFELAPSINAADICILPMKWRYYVESNHVAQATQLAEAAKCAGKVVTVWAIGDFTAHIPFEATSFEMSLNRSKRKQRQFAFPSLFGDYASVYFSAFHLRPSTAPVYVEALAQYHTQWITGYSNSIYQVALMILDQNLHPPPLKAIITTSEKITPAMRTIIELAFSTHVYEEYGTVEDLFYVCECEQGRKHINPDAGVLEIVDAQFQPVPPGVEGEVLATGFIRLNQPMIRYRIGDRAILDDQPCPCGRQMPVLREVVGRIEDTIYGPDGRRLVRFHGIFVNQPHIQEGQIIQDHLNLIRARVVTKPDYSQFDEQEIIRRIQQRLGDSVSVTVEQVDHIERTTSGNFAR